MKKVMLLAVMVTGMTSYTIAQEAAPEQSEKGQAIRTVAQGQEAGQEKGQLVSEKAKETGTTRSAEAKATADGGQDTNTSRVNENASHGTEVKAVAKDQTVTGREKGAAVKAVASSRSKSKRGERPTRERTKRPEHAKRPATTGRPTNPGRP